MKPCLRPMRSMSSAAGIVVHMVAMNWEARGRVAQDLFSARAKPTSAAVVTIREVELSIKAWQVASRGTLRRNEFIVRDLD